MKRFILIFIIFNIEAMGSFENYEFGSKSISMGSAFSGLSNDLFSIYYNPSGLINIQKYGLSCFISPNPFGLKELSTSIVALNILTKHGNIGLAFRKYGFDLYKEFTGSIAFSKSINGINFGTAIHINNLFIKNYGSDVALGLDAGVLFSLIKNLKIGFNIKNINAPTIGKNKEKLPQVILTGISYTPSQNFSMTCDVHKEYKTDLSFSSGAEYKPLKMIALRIGLRNIPSTYSAGFGLEYQFFYLDYSFTNNSELGISHTITLSILIGGKND